MGLGAIWKGPVEMLESGLMEWLGQHGLHSSGWGVAGNVFDDFSDIRVSLFETAQHLGDLAGKGVGLRVEVVVPERFYS